MEEIKTVDWSDVTNPESEYNKNITKGHTDYLNSILEGLDNGKVYTISFNINSRFGYGLYFNVVNRKQFADVINMLFEQEIESANSFWESVKEANKKGQPFYDGMVFSNSTSRREKAEQSKSLEDIFDFVEFMGYNRLKIREIADEKEKSWDSNKYNDYKVIGEKLKSNYREKIQ